ncbi:MAG: stage V sporulation protein S [Candidatus Altiarchaeales archaeon]|nr:stage V sporulation protein S [Candidatus Altiarchaeales archaeon]
MSEEEQREERKEKVLRVSGGTDCHRLGASIAHVVAKDGHDCIIESIGAGAGNQAEKAVITANGILSRQGIYLSIIPSFVSRVVDGKERNAIQRKVLVHRL